MNNKTIVFTTCIFSFLITACCGEIRSPQIVDVTPLYNLKITNPMNTLDDIINPEIFESYEGGKTYGIGSWPQHPNWGEVEVRFKLTPDHPTSLVIFNSNCESYFQDPSKFIYGGEYDNQYCISYVIRERSDPEGFCVPMEYYSSHVVFQKGRLIIKIRETSSDKNIWVKDQVIKFLAEELGK
jgi:hypothetical protein